jgi:hypothetical protein
MRKGENMTRTATIYYQKKAATALEKEFGFAPARLNKIVLLESDDMGFYIHFRIGEHYYTYREASCFQDGKKIERTDDKGRAL